MLDQQHLSNELQTEKPRVKLFNKILTDTGIAVVNAKGSREKNALFLYFINKGDDIYGLILFSKHKNDLYNILAKKKLTTFLNILALNRN